MQGPTAQGECLWALQVRPLARTNHVVALQEAGAPPASASNSLTNRWVRHGFTIEEYLWETGTRRRPETYYLYWMRTDTFPDRRDGSTWRSSSPRPTGPST